MGPAKLIGLSFSFFKHVQDIAFQKVSGFKISVTTYDFLKCLLISVLFYS